MHSTLAADRLHVTVDLLILSVHDGALELLLARRPDPPFAGRWALPGRFVAPDESAEAAVRRLLEEMLPLPNAYQEQLYTFTDVNRDPRGRVISVAYLVILPWQHLREALEDSGARLRGFQVSREDGRIRLESGDGAALTGGDLAFDHGRIIDTGVTRLQGKIDYTDIGFRFLNDPSAFSLSELQAVFEAVLGTSLDSSNFRRFIRARYEETGRIALTDREEKRKRGRPAALYRLTEQAGRQ